MDHFHRAAAALRRSSTFAVGLVLVGALAACGSSGGQSIANQSPMLPRHSATTTAPTPAVSSGVAAPLAGRGGTVPIKVVTASNAALALVPVLIDGKGPFVFALDTGASRSLLDSNVAEQLGFSPKGHHTTTGVSCTTQAQQIRVSRWSAGPVTLPADTLSVTDLGGSTSGGGLQGLLGSDVLSQYGTITVDYAGGELLLGTTVHTPASATTVPLKAVRASNGATLALVPVMIDGKGPFTFALDTGAATSTLAQSVAQQVGLSLRQTHKKVTGVACSTNVKQATLQSWSVGGRQLPATSVDVLQFPGAAGKSLQGLLGSNVLSDFRQVTVDYQHGELRLPSQQGAR